MRLSSITTLSIATLAGLAVSMPVVESERSNSTSWEKRANTDPWHSCSDTNWRAYGERAFLAGIRLMGRKDADPMMMYLDPLLMPNVYTGIPGMCNRLWCGGNQKKGVAVAFYLCLKPETPQLDLQARDLAQKFHDGFHDCNGKREPEDDGDNKLLAFHVWDDGWDLHVEGGYDGMDCPADMMKTAWPRPDALNWIPYTKWPRPA